MAIERMRLNHFLAIKRFRDRYVAAILKMKADGVYQVFVDWHGDPNVGVVAHDNVTFVHWHRAFIRLFEIELQKADEALQTAADPNFDAKDLISLPYWDYRRLNSPDPKKKKGALWKDTFLGPDGNSANSNIVEDGPFGSTAGDWDLVERHPADLALSVERHDPLTPASLTRRLNKNGRPLPRFKEEFRTYSKIKAFDNNLMREDGVNNPADSDSFRAVLEGFAPVPVLKPTGQSSMHNGAHTWVGGRMGSVPTAPNDPVFWLHHANIDRLWAIWQTKHPKKADQYPSDADITAIQGPLPGKNPQAIKESEAMFPWDSAGKAWRNPAGNVALTTGVIRPEDVHNWTKMSAGLGSYRIRGVSSKKIKF